MKGVGGFLDILTNVLTLIIGFVFIYLGINGISISPFFVLILGIVFILFAIFSFTN